MTSLPSPGRLAGPPGTSRNWTENLTGGRQLDDPRGGGPILLHLFFCIKRDVPRWENMIFFTTLLRKFKPACTLVLHAMYYIYIRGIAPLPRKRQMLPPGQRPGSGAAGAPLFHLYRPTSRLIIHKCCVDLCGSLWIFVDLCGSLWIFVDICGYSIQSYLHAGRPLY